MQGWWEDTKQDFLHRLSPGTLHLGWNQQKVGAFPPSPLERMGIIPDQFKQDGVQLLILATKTLQPSLQTSGFTWGLSTFVP